MTTTDLLAALRDTESCERHRNSDMPFAVLAAALCDACALKLLSALGAKAAEIAAEYTVDRPYMADGPEKREWENGVNDASMGIEYAIREAFGVGRKEP